MVLEVAVLNIRTGEETRFEKAMEAARPLIAASPGFGSIQIHRCIETPSRYLLLVSWRSVEDHEIGFRQSDRYARWKEALHPFYDPFPQVEHYGSSLFQQP